MNFGRRPAYLAGGTGWPGHWASLPVVDCGRDLGTNTSI